VPKSVDSDPVGPAGISMLINFLLIFIFAVQHTIIAPRLLSNGWPNVSLNPLSVVSLFL